MSRPLARPSMGPSGQAHNKALDYDSDAPLSISAIARRGRARIHQRAGHPATPTSNQVTRMVHGGLTGRHLLLIDFQRSG